MDLPPHRTCTRPTPTVTEGRQGPVVTLNLQPMFPPPPLAPLSLSALSEIAAELSLLGQRRTKHPSFSNGQYPQHHAHATSWVSLMSPNISHSHLPPNTDATPPLRLSPAETETEDKPEHDADGGINMNRIPIAHRKS